MVPSLHDPTDTESEILCITLGIRKMWACWEKCKEVWILLGKGNYYAILTVPLYI